MPQGPTPQGAVSNGSAPVRPALPGPADSRPVQARPNLAEPAAVRPVQSARPAAGTASPRRPEPPDLADRPSRPAANHDEDDERASRSLARDWLMFVVETVFAACLGLGLWLGFHSLWETQPYVAAAGSGVVLVGLHAGASWIRRRQTGGELDLFTSAVVVAVGVAITVLPAAFAIRPT